MFSVQYIVQIVENMIIGRGEVEDDGWFLTAGSLVLKLFLEQCQVLRYHEAIMVKNG